MPPKEEIAHGVGLRGFLAPMVCEGACPEKMERREDPWKNPHFAPQQKIIPIFPRATDAFMGKRFLPHLANRISWRTTPFEDLGPPNR